MHKDQTADNHSSPMKGLLASFGEMAHLSKEGEEALMQILQKKVVRKKEILLTEGRVSNEIFFVEKGVARAYYYKGNREVTFWIASENEFIGSLASFFSRTPSTKYIETLEECTLWVFDHDKLETLYATSKELERMGRLFTSYGICVLEKKFDDFHSLTGIEKYNLLLARYPKILQSVSLGIIASYLGVSQETLSRIRGQVIF
jgi:CRP-like cAMP-binding protein